MSGLYFDVPCPKCGAGSYQPADEHPTFNDFDIWVCGWCNHTFDITTHPDWDNERQRVVSNNDLTARDRYLGREVPGPVQLRGRP